MTALGIIAGLSLAGFLVLWISAAGRIARAEFGERYRRDYAAGRTSEPFDVWVKRTGVGDAGRTSSGSGASAAGEDVHREDAKGAKEGGAA